MTSVGSDFARTATPESLKVLVVDDDEDVRMMMSEAVTGLGYSCEVASDGLEACEMHTLNRADIIISDWKMPRMSGLELCERVRADDPESAYVHFIFLTANRDSEQVREGMRAGADDYLVKPLDFAELKGRLLLARRRLLLRRELRESKGATKRERKPD